MTPEEISRHFRLLDHMWEMPDPERAERLARLEAALATDPPEDLAMRLRALVACYQPPRPPTRQEVIDRRFTGVHERSWSGEVERERRRRGIVDPWPRCGTYGTVSIPGDYWHVCAHSALLDMAAALASRPAIAVATVDGREMRDVDLGGDDTGCSIDAGRLGDTTGTCTCPHDCAWTGLLRDMWIEGGHVVCPGCHDTECVAAAAARG